IAQGRYDEALQVASEPNPFPCICGRVCTAPCEDVCRRGEFDSPIAIRDLKRFTMDNGAPSKRKVTPPRHRRAERVAIVGAGPTGLSAAYYLARRGYSVTIYDAMPVAGGMMAIGIPAYRLPRAELNRDIDAICELGVELRLNTAMDAARSALRAGASSVQILYRRTRAEMPAQVEEVRAALEEGIQILELVAPLSILGTEEGNVSGIRCQRMQLGEADARGRRSPV